jgi:hypothetical protein
MKELYELIKYLKDNGYEHLKINPDLLVGMVEYFESKQKPKKCTLTDVSQQRELLIAFLEMNNWLSLEDEENAKGVVDCYLKAINCA